MAALTPQRRVALAATAGLLHFLSGPLFGHWLLAWFSLLPLLWALDAKLRPLRAAALGWIFGWISCLGTCPWLVDGLRARGELGGAAAVLLYTGGCGIAGLPFAMWGEAVARLRPRVDVLWSAVPCWILLEWAFALPPGTQLATSQHGRVLLLQTLEVWGALGLTGLVVLGNVVAYGWLRAAASRRRLPAGLASVFLLGLAGSLAYGQLALWDHADTLNTARTRLRLGLIQTQLDTPSGVQAPQRAVRRLRKQTREAERQGAQVIVWGLGAYPYALPQHRMPHAHRAGLHRPALVAARWPHPPAGTTAAATGPPSPNGPAPATSGVAARAAIFALRGDGLRVDATQPTRWPRPHSVAAHWRVLWPLLPLPQPWAATSGTHLVALQTLEGIDLGVVAGEQPPSGSVFRQLVNNGARFLLTTADPSGYQNTSRPWVHLAIAQLRAVETRRFIAHSSNAGVSGIVAPTGHIQRTAAPFARANLVEPIVATNHRTAFARWGSWPAIPAAACLAWWLRHLWMTPTRWAITRLWRLAVRKWTRPEL